MTILKYIFIKKSENISKRVTSKHVTENVKERPALPSLKRVRSHPLSPCTAKKMEKMNFFIFKIILLSYPNFLFQLPSLEFFKLNSIIIFLVTIILFQKYNLK